jgi:hypothetical protein
MSSLDILKSVAVALVMLVLGVTGFMFLHPFDPVFRFAGMVALGVVSVAASVIYFYSVIKA